MIALGMACDLIIMVVVEIATMGLTTIWFAGGALAAFIACAAGAVLPVQIILFFGVSCVLLAFTRPIVKKRFNQDRVRTNAELLIGEKGDCFGDDRQPECHGTGAGARPGVDGPFPGGRRCHTERRSSYYTRH